MNYIRKVVVCIVMLVMLVGTSANAQVVRGYSQNDVTVRSNLSESKIKELLPPRMKELSSILYQIERSNKPINALFLMSLIRLETGNGTSYSYRVRKNCGGVMGRYGLRSFNSREQCLLYMQDFLYRRYINIGRKSVWRIGKKYCVGGNWAYKVNSLAINYMYRANR